MVFANRTHNTLWTVATLAALALASATTLARCTPAERQQAAQGAHEAADATRAMAPLCAAIARAFGREDIAGACTTASDVAKPLGELAARAADAGVEGGDDDAR